jgi:hypothetical protein
MVDKGERHQAAAHWPISLLARSPGPHVRHMQPTASAPSRILLEKHANTSIDLTDYHYCTVLKTFIHS